ncbi:hypothetical protein WME98_34080 [Sorangium sp. So ce296]|uniref:hypothetical protein n=1 Tax=Sorangium sp. So ce296 TaxID=3133296 RepID=UPI003F61BD07
MYQESLTIGASSVTINSLFADAAAARFAAGAIVSEHLPAISTPSEPRDSDMADCCWIIVATSGCST